MATRSGILLVGFSDEPTETQTRRLGLDHVSALFQHPRIYAGPLPFSPEILDFLNEGLRDHSIRSVALLTELPDADHLWIAFEWWHKLVVSDGYEGRMNEQSEKWRLVGRRRDLQLVIFEPLDFTADESPLEPSRPEGDPDEFRSQVQTVKPAFAVVNTASVPDLRLWYGDLAEPSIGGANVLFTISSSDRTPTSVTLRNPAALGMNFRADQSSLGHLVASGKVTAAINATTWDNVERVLGSAGDYVVVLSLGADVDPEVVIPAGSIFEQLAPTAGHQALATTVRVSVTVSPGRTTLVGIRAWCLNQNLSAPTGQFVRPTPLVLASQPADQSELWRSLTARLRKSGG